MEISMKIVNCKVNHLKNPLGYYMDHTVFSWVVEESGGKRQAGARIQVWSNGAVAADTGWAHQIGRASCRERVCLYV